MNQLITRITTIDGAQASKTAVIWDGKKYSYEAFAEMIDRRADLLRRAGIAALEVVVVEGRRALDSLVDLAALWKLGCAVLPYPAGSGVQLVNSMVRSAGASWLMEPGHDPRPVGNSEFADWSPIITDATMLILPTSGSTGRPKLVPLSERAIGAFIQWAGDTFALSHRTVLAFAPINFDLSLLEIWATLATGGTVDVVSDEEAHNPRVLREHLNHSNVDLIQAVPYIFQTLEGPADEPALILPGVKDVIVTGAKASRETRRWMVRAFPTASFHNVYGATETNNSFIYSATNCTEFSETDVLPIGRPLPNVESYVLDSDGNIMAGEATGELHVRTPFMMHGYVGTPIYESDAFPTGDIVYRNEEGVFYIESRSSRIVKIRGNRTSLDQIEMVLDSNRSVEESVVIAREDAESGSRIEAFVKLRANETATALSLRQHCAGYLPDYSMPAVIRIVSQSFPRTSTHKIDRNMLISTA